MMVSEVVVKAPHAGRMLKKGAPDLVKLSTAMIDAFFPGDLADLPRTYTQATSGGWLSWHILSNTTWLETYYGFIPK